MPPLQFVRDDSLSRAVEAWRAACGDAFDDRPVFAWHSATRGERTVSLCFDGLLPPHVKDRKTNRCWIIRKRRLEAEEEEGEEGEEESDEEGCVDELTCPITLRRFRDPIRAPDGHVYERRALQRWLTQHRNTSPLTNLPMQYVDVETPHGRETARR